MRSHPVKHHAQANELEYRQLKPGKVRIKKQPLDTQTLVQKLTTTYIHVHVSVSMPPTVI